MGIAANKRKLAEWIKKYKLSILILLIGFILMVLPLNIQSDNKGTVQETIKEQKLEQKLSDALSQMSGAGKVKVILTMSAGEEVIYQTNEDTNENDSSIQKKIDTVTITDSSRNQAGLVRQINPERYEGAIVLCQGADDPRICLLIVEAISKATGLGANKISVLKMK